MHAVRRVALGFVVSAIYVATGCIDSVDSGSVETSFRSVP